MKTMKNAIAQWMANGHLFVSEALRIEMSGSQAWVVDNETRSAIKLYASKAAAEKAIRRAITAWEGSQ